MNITTIELGKVENSCFVAMPFSPLFQVEYEKIIQPVLQNMDITCIRGDEIYTKQRIVDDIWNSIKTCRFVLAELTGKNPNVIYEIGLAHAIGKPVIIITRNGDDVPFDLKALRYLFYDVNDPFWGENLKLGLQNLINKVIENPTIENYLDGITASIVEYPKLSKEKKVVKVNAKKLNILGTWQGEFTDSAKKVHKVTLQINEEKGFFSGAAVITILNQEKLTVVQQIMSITVDGNSIKMRGVNYTYIEQGMSPGYALDNFDLIYYEESNTLAGKVVSEYSDETILDVEVSFKRL